MLVLTVSPANAASSSSSIQARVASVAVHMTANLSIVQNLTSFQANMTLPEFRGTLTGANSSDLASSLQTAIQSEVPSATVDNAVLQEETSPWSNSTKVQYLNLTLDYDVHKVGTNQNGVYNVDMSWKSWTSSSPIALGAFEANKIGAYLFNGANAIASMPQTQLIANGAIVIRLTLEVNTRVFNAATFPSHVEGLSILNFSQMTKPISTWEQSFDFAGDTTSWSLDLGRIRLIDVYETTVESNNASRTDYVLGYTLQARITAPAGSSAKGDVVLVFQGTQEGLMGAIILASAVIGSASFLWERRIMSKNPRRRGRK